MLIQSVFEKSFAPYGRIVEGYDTAGILNALAETPCPAEGTAYTARVQALHDAPGAQALGEALLGGMPFQLGCCNGRNTRLNCLEFHRDSEFNLGTEDFILLLARMEDMENDQLDTEKVKAFFVPKGVLIEVYATTLHFAPCHNDPRQGFRVLVMLPEGTNTPYRPDSGKNTRDKTLWARNKWLLAHADAPAAQKGAYVGVVGVNHDIAKDLPFRG